MYSYNWRNIRTIFENLGYSFREPDSEKERYSSTKPTCLLISHQYSLTGAPQALFLMAKVLKPYCNLLVASVEEGPIERLYLDEGIPSVMIGRYWENEGTFFTFGSVFDLVIANTVLNFPAAILLNGAPVPVYWWIHEHENYFSYGRGEIPNPNNLKDNIHVWAASEYIRNILLTEFDFDSRVLATGIEDSCNEDVKDLEIKEKLEFLVIGTYGWEKGQDIAVEAYKQLPEYYKEHICLTFIGDEDNCDKDIYGGILELCESEKNIKKLPLMSRNKLMELLKSIEGGVLVSSRRETLSMVAAEAMMIKRLPLISEGAGIAEYVTHLENGYLFKSGDAKELTKALQYLWDNKKQTEYMAKNARILYEKCFSEEAFQKNVKGLLGYE